MLVLGNLIDDYARDGSEHTVSINTINKYALKLLGFSIGVAFSAFIGRVDNLFELPAMHICCLPHFGCDPFSSSSVHRPFGFISWRKRKKHFFIPSNSGKPIYSRGDFVKWVRAEKHQVVFLVKGPIYSVCISSTEEPYESLRGQLDLIYGQADIYLMMLTTNSDAFYHLKDCRIRIER
ncbi:vacuolar fusion protein MON1 protein [Trifolium repens]|nr:vacuolar fusion protein MON1 protein [Trifolium repens]